MVKNKIKNKIKNIIMKEIKLSFILLFVFTIMSCTTVESGHRGVKIHFGKTDTKEVYGEGMHSGLNWLWDDMVEYDIRQHTMVKEFEFNDKDNMSTKVTIALDYNLMPDKVNMLHGTVKDIDTKIFSTLSSSAKEVVPQFSAVELNIHKRAEAEQMLKQILSKELPEFYVHFARVRFMDVDLPSSVEKLAEETAVQLGRNELASKKEAEQVSLAKAKVAKAKGEFESAEYKAKAQKLLSQPAMLELKKLDVMNNFAEHGISPYGSGNMFGQGANIVKLIK